MRLEPCSPGLTLSHCTLAYQVPEKDMLMHEVIAICAVCADRVVPPSMGSTSSGLGPPSLMIAAADGPGGMQSTGHGQAGAFQMTRLDSMLCWPPKDSQNDCRA